MLTKVDTIEPGTHDTWLPLLRGDKYPLRLGWHCVRSPSQEQMDEGMTLEGAMQSEQRFFQADAFFSNASKLGKATHKLGVPALRDALSRQLVCLMEAELPGLRDAVDRKLKEVRRWAWRVPYPACCSSPKAPVEPANDAIHPSVQVTRELELLPAAPNGDELRELMELLRALARNVEDAVHSADDGAFFSGLRNELLEMRDAIFGAAPTVWLRSMDDERDADATIAPWLCKRGAITLEDVKKLAHRFRGDQLPTYHSYRTLQQLVERSKGRWGAHTDACIQGVYEQLQQLVQHLVRVHFGRFPAAARHIGCGLCSWDAQEVLHRCSTPQHCVLCGRGVLW